MAIKVVSELDEALAELHNATKLSPEDQDTVVRELRSAKRFEAAELAYNMEIALAAARVRARIPQA